jgi:predicted kinase
VTGPSFETCVVFMLGYPGMGKRTVGRHLAGLLDGVLVDNALVSRPVLELFRWDGVFPLPPQVWDHVVPIRDAVVRAIEEIAPASNSYVFTNVVEDGPDAPEQYGVVRSLAHRRGSLFLAVVLTCDLDEQVSRIDNPDRIAARKGADPEGYRRYTQTTRLFQPPAEEAVTIDTTSTPPEENARHLLAVLRERGFRPA